MLKLLEELTLRTVNLGCDYRVTTKPITLFLGRIRLKIETAKSETYHLNIQGEYTVKSYKQVPSNYNIILDTANIDIRDNYYLVPEDYTIQTASELLNKLLSDMQTNENQFLLTNEQVFLNLNLNPISKIYILGIESHSVSLPVFSEIHRLATK
jgi:hypothetical protein